MSSSSKQSITGILPAVMALALTGLGTPLALGADLDQSQVFYVTNRLPVHAPDTPNSLTSYYSSDHAGGLFAGRVIVSHPKDKLLAGISEVKITRHQRGRLATLCAQIPGNRDGELLIYVHGYRVQPDEAVRTAAQVAADVGYEGALLAFLWPTQGTTGVAEGAASGGVLGAASNAWQVYRTDERSNKASWTPFNRALNTIARCPKVRQLHVVAHSMGNRIALQGMEQLAMQANQELIDKLHEVLFASPDVEKKRFHKGIRRISGHAERLTLYANYWDYPVGLSQWIHWDTRAGIGGHANLVVSRDLESVDWTELKGLSDGTGHSMYSHNRRNLLDLEEIIVGHLPAAKRDLAEGRKRDLPFWYYRPQPGGWQLMSAKAEQAPEGTMCQQLCAGVHPTPEQIEDAAFRYLESRAAADEARLNALFRLHEMAVRIDQLERGIPIVLNSGESLPAQSVSHPLDACGC